MTTGSRGTVFERDFPRDEPNTHIWPTERERARGTVVIVPGRGEDSRSYRRLGSRLNFDGYDTIVLSRHVASPAELTTALQRARRVQPLVHPVVVIGVDTSAASVSYAAAHDDGIDAVVVAGGVAGVPTYIPRDRDEEISLRSECPDHLKLLRSIDQRVSYRAPVDGRTAAWLSRPFLLQKPALIVHGERDVLADAAAIAAVAGSWPLQQMYFVDGGLHDVLNDVHHRSVAALIVAFIERVRTGVTRGSVLYPVGTASRFGVFDRDEPPV